LNEAPYRWFDHTADVGMEVWGESLPRLFAHAALGLYDLMGAPATLERRVEEEIRLEGADLGELLVAWLGELAYRLAAHGHVYGEAEPVVEGTALSARLVGGVVPEGVRRMAREVKAATYHELVVRRTPGGWEARVVFDI
jgi:SHS2 domain-containing protein